MTEMRDNNSTIAFIGPDGQCAAEALVAAAWNLPMITHVMITSLSLSPFFLCLYKSLVWPLFSRAQQVRIETNCLVLERAKE